ncbi:hypothetical protein EDD96_0132 [Streptomyces sp. Ag109_G2-6]|nr:hypothetical protein EDD96_0132 [Streptomyces sp. Ag109_G2-6]
MPHCRFVVITWVEAETSDDETDALGGKRNWGAWGAGRGRPDDR